MKKNKNKPGADAKSKKQIEQTAQKLAEPEFAALGYEIWDVEYYSDGSEWVLEITIENLSGAPITIEDCEKATRAINPAIDQADPIEHSYCLAVGSPGLNRELKKAAHMERYIGKEVTVKLFAKNETAGGKSFDAILKEAGGAQKGFVFELAGETNLAIPKKEIAHIYARDADRSYL
ncbi:MAG: ribosome maturation factor RimP [Oscillospiraceae bacterium]|nr:ribosome maturation factor RimP [Oscillospiraceae bacterium]